MEKKKELRCPDCDYVLIDKDGKETDVLLTVESNDARYGLCKKCGSFVFVKCDEGEIYVEDGIDALTYILLASIVSGLLAENKIDLDEVVKEYNEKEKEEKEIFLKNKNSITTYKDVFDSAKRPVDKGFKAVEKCEEPSKSLNDFIKSITRPTGVSVSLDSEPLRQIPDFDEDCILKHNKYILLSRRHDSWKIFNSEKELTEELSKIPANADILVYELGAEKKLKYNVSLV